MCLGGGYTIYIFRKDTEYVNWDFHFIVDGVKKYRPLYIHQVFTCFSFFFQCVVFRGVGTFICIDRWYCFSIPLQASLTFPLPTLHRAAAAKQLLRKLDSCHCNRSQLGDDAPNFQYQRWISLWCLAGFISWKWTVSCWVFWGFFAENISRVGFILNGWWVRSYPTHSFHWFLTSWTPYWVLLLLLLFFKFCRAILSLTRVCTFFFHAHFICSFDMWY